MLILIMLRIIAWVFIFKLSDFDRHLKEQKLLSVLASVIIVVIEIVPMETVAPQRKVACGNITLYRLINLKEYTVVFLITLKPDGCVNNSNTEV